MENSTGYKSLKKAVQSDCKGGNGCFNQNGCDKERYANIPQDNPKLVEMGFKTQCVNTTKCFHSYCDKFKWVVDRASNYADSIGVTVPEILDAWEQKRTYWYMNYYQECNQPLIQNGLTVYESQADFQKKIKTWEFRCPSCGGISTDPNKCTCEGCDWKSYGLLGTMGEGITIIFKDTLEMHHIFKPIAKEAE